MGSKPVYEELRGEIVELVGQDRYDWFVDHIRVAAPDADPAAPGPPPTLRRDGSI